MTIGINYQENFYPRLLTHKAKHHIHLLVNNRISISELDKQLLATLSPAELETYYSNAFHEQHLIPHSDVDIYDYNIELDDFYNKSTMSTHFNNIGLPFTKESEQFYDSWLKLQ